MWIAPRLAANCRVVLKFDHPCALATRGRIALPGDRTRPEFPHRRGEQPAPTAASGRHHTPWLKVSLTSSTRVGRSSTSSTRAGPRGGHCLDWCLVLCEGLYHEWPELGPGVVRPRWRAWPLLHRLLVGGHSLTGGSAPWFAWRDGGTTTQRLGGRGQARRRHAMAS